MPKWVSVFEKPPTHQGWYFAKVNGNKKLLHLHDFQREASGCETFLYLDESDDNRKEVEGLLGINNMDEFCKHDYRVISNKLIIPYSPYVPKSIVINTFHKYYLRIIASLRKEISQMSKGTFQTVKRTTPEPLAPKTNRLIDRINELNNNSFF